jgi:hypothetical protein
VLDLAMEFQDRSIESLLAEGAIITQVDKAAFREPSSRSTTASPTRSRRTSFSKRSGASDLTSGLPGNAAVRSVVDGYGSS